LDDRILTAVNGFARATPWLHGFVLGYADYGVVLFVALLVAGWWSARRNGEGMSAALWRRRRRCSRWRSAFPATSSAQTMPPG
jgi:hypothetical protein